MKCDECKSEDIDKIMEPTKNNNWKYAFLECNDCGSPKIKFAKSHSNKEEFRRKFS